MTLLTVKSSAWQARRGYATVMTLLFISIGTTLAGGFYCMLNSSVSISANEQRSGQALSSAESGLQFMEYQIIKASVNANLNGSSEKWLDSLAVQLAQNLEGANGSNILATGQVASMFYTVWVPKWGTPAIRLKNGCTFTSRLFPNSSLTNLVLTVTGKDPSGTTSRTVQIGINAHPPIPADLGGFAMVAKGPITIQGSAEIDGYDPTINSANNLVGRVYRPWGTTGSSVVALLDPEAPDLVFDNPPPLTIPQVDVSFLAGLKGSKLTKYTVPSHTPSVETVENAYVPAGTNRLFSNVVINGVLYVEWPNNITFGGNVTLNGTIVYQRSTGSGTSTISFSKNSVVTNSATASADQLNKVGLTSDQRKALSGWSILAPDTDLTLANGNGVQKAFGGSLHINNLNKASGQGSADSTLCLNKANIICEGAVDLTGNRVFWILPPGDLAGSGSLGKSSYLYAMTETYLEP